MNEEEKASLDATELTAKDIDDFVEKMMGSEIPVHTCCKCVSKYYGGSYGHHMGYCDECFFAMFPKEDVERFCKSFFY